MEREGLRDWEQSVFHLYFREVAWEKRPEKCKAFHWLNSPAIPGILSYFYLALRKTLRVLKVFVVCQC